MTMLDEDTDLDVILIESLDFEPACSVGNEEATRAAGLPPCDIPAVWAYRCRQCGVVYPYCAPHKEAIDKSMEVLANDVRVRIQRALLRMPEGWTGYYCLSCNGPLIHPAPWQPLK